MPVSVKIEGLQALVSKMNALPKEIEKKVQDELIDWGNNTRNRAIRNLSQPYPDGALDRGILKNAIQVDKKPLNVSVVVASNYAAYVEFGTKKFAAKYVATLPQDWQTFAAQFKGGGGGSAEELLKRITEWVIRKGFAAYKTKGGNISKSKNSLQAQESAAYIIALRILQNGTRAHPFLYPAAEESRVELERNLKTLFQ